MVEIAWTTPITAVTNAALTAAQWNASVRDNLNETAPAKATSSANARHIVPNGLNSIAQREVLQASISTVETSTDTSYADLATVGPSVTITTGTAALLHFAAMMENSSAGALTRVSVGCSGATTFSPSNDWAITTEPASAAQTTRQGASYLRTGLTSGSNTFYLQYRVNSGTGTFSVRSLIAMAF